MAYGVSLDLSSRTIPSWEVCTMVLGPGGVCGPTVGPIIEQFRYQLVRIIVSSRGNGGPVDTVLQNIALGRRLYLSKDNQSLTIELHLSQLLLTVCTTVLRRPYCHGLLRFTVTPRICLLLQLPQPLLPLRCRFPLSTTPVIHYLHPRHMTSSSTNPIRKNRRPPRLLQL